LETKRVFYQQARSRFRKKYGGKKSRISAGDGGRKEDWGVKRKKAADKRSASPVAGETQ
jgi:hypothetical protein